MNYQEKESCCEDLFAGRKEDSSIISNTMSEFFLDVGGKNQLKLVCQNSSIDNISHKSKVEGINVGRWSSDEQLQFLKGLIEYGNNWIKVQNHIKTRTGSQIRSHAQKFFISLEKVVNISKPKMKLNFQEIRSELSNKLTKNPQQRRKVMCLLSDKNLNQIVRLLKSYYDLTDFSNRLPKKFQIFESNKTQFKASKERSFSCDSVENYDVDGHLKDKAVKCIIKPKLKKKSQQDKKSQKISKVDEKVNQSFEEYLLKPFGAVTKLDYCNLTTNAPKLFSSNSDVYSTKDIGFSSVNLDFHPGNTMESNSNQKSENGSSISNNITMNVDLSLLDYNYSQIISLEEIYQTKNRINCIRYDGEVMGSCDDES